MHLLYYFPNMCCVLLILPHNISDTHNDRDNADEKISLFYPLSLVNYNFYFIWVWKLGKKNLRFHLVDPRLDLLLYFKFVFQFSLSFLILCP